MPVIARVDPSELLSAQRLLRDRLLGRPLSSGRRAARELAAEMLLHLDDAEACWRLGLAWLLEATQADRVDGGFSSASSPRYQPAAEQIRCASGMPSITGTVLNARDPGVAIVWSKHQVVAFHDVATDPRLGAPVRAALLSAQARRKMAVALRDEGRDIGLLCVDGVSASTPWTAPTCVLLEQVAQEVLSPILAMSRRLGAADAPPQPSSAADTSAAGPRVRLTPAEQRVARLVGQGLSYKEIARELDRSLATIDHQLRSIRLKVGVRSNARLVRELGRILPAMASDEEHPAQTL